MLGLAQVCRFSNYFRAPSRILLSSTKTHGALPSRQLITPAQWKNTTQSFRVSIKNNINIGSFVSRRKIFVLIPKFVSWCLQILE